MQVSKKEERKTDYTCPMHPEVHQAGPGNCPKCGMALEPATVVLLASRTEYTCPMHSQIVRDHPGNCPICGMALEPRDATADTGNPELVNMTRRFWVGVALTLPLLAVMISDILPGHPIQHLLRGTLLGWIEFAFATPVVLWEGWPFFQRGWESVVHRSPNMFTLIAIGVVFAELGAIAWIRHRFMDTPWLPATFQVVIGGVLVFLTGVFIGSS